MTRLKHSCQGFVAGGTPDSDNSAFWADDVDGTPWVAIGDLTRGPRIARTERTLTAAGLAARKLAVLPAGTILYSMYASLGKVATLDVPAATNQAILGVIPDRRMLQAPFLRWWLESLEPHVRQFSSSNTQDNLNAETVRNMPLYLPSRSEQRAIADFLDRETEKIDALVAKKQRLIELLQEKRTALISRAVTKGLDPDVPMKDSGVEWLGQIPQAWNVLPIRRLAARVQTGSTPPTEVEAYYRNGELPWFGPGSFGVALQLTAPTKWIAASAAEQGAARVFDAGSTFVVCIGATLGKVGLVSAPSSANQQITAITWRAGSIDPLYGALQMKSLEPLLPGIAPASTLPILDQSKIMELPIVVPPLGQQEQIARWLCAQTDAIDALLAKIREATLRLGEYRSSLITAAVTGQIDVRTYRRQAS